MDIRVIKEFFRLTFKGLVIMGAGVVAFVVAGYVSDRLFGNADFGPLLAIFSYAPFLIYQMAKFNVDHERRIEQRLIETLKRTGDAK